MITDKQRHRQSPFYIREINKRLKKNYGTDVQGRPNFRLTFSEWETEHRYGQYNEMYRDIFLREYTGIKEVKKYQENPPCWVLELLQWNDTNGEVVGTDVTYEPLWLFKDDNHEPVEPNEKAVLMLVNSLINGRKYDGHNDPSAVGSDEFNAKELEEIYESIDDKFPYIPTLLHDQEAVFVDSQKVFKPKSQSGGKDA